MRRRACIAVVCAALLGPPIRVVWGQAVPAGLGRISGTVYDSLLGAPLGGARVSLGDGSRSAEADAQGRYVLDSVPAGSHFLTFWRADLDSAGLWNLGDSVTIVPGREVTLHLAVPSRANMWLKLCGATEPASGSERGVIYGVITDASTRAPAAGAWASVYWLIAGQDQEGHLVPEWRSRSVLSDARGRYARCGVPTGSRLLLQATLGPFTSGLVDLALGERGVVSQDLWVGRDSVTTAEGAVPTSASRGTATLQGSVRSRGGDALEGAVVNLDDVEASAISDASGSFELGNLPSGTQMLTVRRVGHQAHRQPVHIIADGTTNIEVALWGIVVLDTVQVIGRRRYTARRRLAERRQSGMGYIRDSTEIGRMVEMRHVFSMLPRLRVIPGKTPFDFGLRMLGMGGTRAMLCSPDIYLDGSPANEEWLASYRPRDLAAVEFYPHGAPTALFSRPGQACGVVLVWTKLYLR